MKKAMIIICALLLMAGCSQNSKVSGTYVSENSMSGWITFSNDEMCQFDWFLMTITAKYEVKGTSIYIHTNNSEFGIQKLKIIDSNTIQGDGWLKGTFVKKQQPR